MQTSKKEPHQCPDAASECQSGERFCLFYAFTVRADVQTLTFFICVHTQAHGFINDFQQHQAHDTAVQNCNHDAFDLRQPIHTGAADGGVCHFAVLRGAGRSDG